MKKFMASIFILLLVFAVGCSNASENGSQESNSINVVSREDGSGTRGAFVEIVGVVDEDDNDITYEEAIIQNSTNGVMTSVAGDEFSIGYISLGSLNDTVTSVDIEGVEANADNVKSGEYKIARPFNIAYQEGLSELGQDFISFILSEEGQAIVEDNALVSIGEGETYKSSGLSGSLVIDGSTSVTPIMEKLKEAYEALNGGVTIEIQSTGSSAGMTATMEGSADIGMASRDLKDSEKAELTYQAIAMDGIAIIVNNSNSIDNLTIDQVKEIYLGNTKDWSQLK